MITSNLKTITPQIAADILKNNIFNRKVNKSRVSYYADLMKRGLWHLNGESIIISKDGVLLNGQHRLLAIIQADANIQTILVSGVDQNAFSTLDQGLSRTAAQVFDISNVKNYALVASIVNKHIKAQVSLKGLNPRQISNKEELLQEYFENSKMYDMSLFYARSLYNNTNAAVNISDTGTMYCLLYVVNHKKCDQFFETVINPEMLSKYHPCYFLKTTLLKYPKLKWPALYNCIVKAWNAYIADEELKSLRFIPEQYPIKINKF
jgi:hypothetical protein